MKIDPIKTSKFVITAATSWGAGVIVKNAIATTTPADIGSMKKIGVMIGGFAVSGIVADAASRYTGGIIDQCVDAYEQVKKGTKTHNITDVK